MITKQEASELFVEAPPVVDSPVRTISVLIVVDVCLYREGLAGALSRTPGISIVRSLADVRDARIAVADLQPDVVLLDPGTDPDFSLIGDVERFAPRSRIVALGVREEEDDVLRCAEAGMAGYVRRDATLAELVDVIEGASRGELRCSPRIAASLFQRVASLTESGGRDQQVPTLTPREQEIASLIDEGLSNKQIAQQLHIGLSTVKNHVHNLLKKLNTSRRSVAVARLRYARRTRSR